MTYDIHPVVRRLAAPFTREARDKSRPLFEWHENGDVSIDYNQRKSCALLTQAEWADIVRQHNRIVRESKPC